jgi:hypothetical protein
MFEKFRAAYHVMSAAKIFIFSIAVPLLIDANSGDTHSVIPEYTHSLFLCFLLQVTFLW